MLGGFTLLEWPSPGAASAESRSEVAADALWVELMDLLNGGVVDWGY